jgi:TPR repeat protein
MSNFVIFKKGEILGGSINYDDVPKYIPSIAAMKNEGDHELANEALTLMLKTGHPLAMVYQADQLISEGKIQEGTELIEKAILTDDTDALLNYGSWVLDGRINEDDVERALKMLREVAKRGHNKLVVAAPAYYLKRIALGFDHVENNSQLSEWLEIFDPKAFKKFEQKKITQSQLIAPIAKAAGLVETGK